MPSETRSMLII